MSSVPYKVADYSIETLVSILSEGSLATPTEISSKLHKIYFEGYFGGIDARTIVVEYNYIDRYYLEDFASYYVKCFDHYERNCTRVHFFCTPFSQRKFSSLLSGKSLTFGKKLQNSYLGFIVVKRLPETIIGRTCLKTYPEEEGRHFTVKRRYEANLFGLKLSVQTLAFQEQDKVVAACATSTLWSMFHGTGRMFNHSIPTPVEITKAANHNFPTQERILPSQGLTLEQMSHAIRNVGLEPYPVNIQNEFILRSTIYAYVKAGIPLGMAVHLYDTSLDPYQLYGDGGHAMTITGYNISDLPPEPYGPTGFLSRSSKINKIYVHDDQVGPFARMNLNNTPGYYQANNEERHFSYSLSTSWKGNDGVIGSVSAAPIAVLLPLFHKMRIPLSKVEAIIVEFDNIIEAFRLYDFFPMLTKRLEWEIYLSNLNDLKTAIFSSENIDNQQRKNILTETMPRFIWCAIASIDNIPKIVYLFDATDIEQGNFFIRAIKYDISFYNVLKSLISQPDISRLLDGRKSNMIFEWIKDN